MLDLSHIPNSQQDIKIFYAASGSNSWQTWQKPRKCNYVWIMCIGGGGGGQSGLVGSGSASGGITTGGGAGAAAFGRLCAIFSRSCAAIAMLLVSSPLDLRARIRSSSTLSPFFAPSVVSEPL